MSYPNPDDQFWQMADAFVGLANEKAQTAERPVVGASLLFAGARFNAYLLARGAGTLEDYTARKEEAVKYFMEQYEKMVRDNLDDYEKNFEQYRA